MSERGEAHVESHRQFAAAAARDALDDGDGRLRHGAEQIDNGVERRQLVVQRGVVGRQLPGSASTSAWAMKNSESAESTITTRTDVVGRDFGAEAAELADQSRHPAG